MTRRDVLEFTLSMLACAAVLAPFILLLSAVE